MLRWYNSKDMIKNKAQRIKTILKKYLDRIETNIMIQVSKV